MCLLLLGWRQHARYPLVLAANRDEFFTRPTESARFWPDNPDVLAGRDAVEGGTWLGITRSGRLAALTNVRAGEPPFPDAPSRGRLVREFLESRVSPARYLAQLEPHASGYNGFNLLLTDGRTLHWYSNRGGAPRELPPGLYGVSNHLLDTPWPKLVRGKRALRTLLEGASIDTEAILALLLDRHSARDEDLPDTGVGLDRERMLSPMFIETATYGTRSSTALIVDRGGRARLSERIHEPGRPATTTASYELPTDGWQQRAAPRNSSTNFRDRTPASGPRSD